MYSCLCVSVCVELIFSLVINFLILFLLSLLFSQKKKNSTLLLIGGEIFCKGKIFFSLNFWWKWNFTDFQQKFWIDPLYFQNQSQLQNPINSIVVQLLTEIKYWNFFFCNLLFSLTLTHLIHSLIIFVWVVKRLLKHGWINVVSFPPSPSQKIFPDNLFKVNWVIIFVCIHCSNNCVVLLLVVKFSSSHFLFGC